MIGVVVREARQCDCAALVELIRQIDFPVEQAGVAERLMLLEDRREPVLVAERGGAVVGMLNWHVMPTIHRARPVGRIVALVVDKAERGRGIGTALVEQAERRMRECGCEKMEVTSNLKLDRAHAFYERYGFKRSSLRFFKNL